MKVLFVVNNLYATANGLSASARRTVRYLKEAGLDVRVISGRNWAADSPQPDYVIPDYHFPIFNKLVASHGYHFAKSDFKVYKEAVGWCDLVHFEEPFGIQYRLVKVAHKMGKPITGTYHLHPENMFASIGLHNWRFLNHICLKWWVDHIFNHCKIVTCPTQNCCDRLKKYHIKVPMRVISNGVIVEEGHHVEHGADAPFEICCIGRLAVEKNQLTLLRAMQYSKYADRIQLRFAGRGPMAGLYMRQATWLYQKGILKYQPTFDFMDKAGLRELAAHSDLNIHCAFIEVEGLSCLEALLQGAVPVIAVASRTGTPQFALDDRSLFRARHAKELAAKIDWWLEHPEEMKAMRPKYMELAASYDIHNSIKQLIQVFEDVLNEEGK